MHRAGVYCEIGVVQNDRKELVEHAFGARPARHSCSTKQVGHYDDVALQQQRGGRPEGRTYRRHRSADPDTWTDQGIISFCNEVLGELMGGALNSHELSKPHEVYLMTQIDMCRLKLVAPDSAGVL